MKNTLKLEIAKLFRQLGKLKKVYPCKFFDCLDFLLECRYEFFSFMLLIRDFTDHENIFNRIIIIPDNIKIVKEIRKNRIY